jgi:hypothetical protein
LSGPWGGGGGIELVHGLPLFMCGTEDRALIRCTLDLMHWLGDTSTDRDIRSACRSFVEHTLGDISSTCSSADSGTGSHDASVPVHRENAGLTASSALEPLNIVLPVSQSRHKTKIFRSPGYSTMPIQIMPASCELEKKCIDALVADLNNVFKTDIGREYSSSRAASCFTDSDLDECKQPRFIICGASHGSRLANALDDADAKVADLSVPGWRPTESNVERMTEQLLEELEEPWEGTTYIVYQLSDNGCYLSVSTDGTTSLPVKSK